ncbi:asparagine synthase (glutamine-hydrolyzing) [Jeotgalibacillus proteolyticus]|uniref:asparagine synthase (glutamine-hydrolyzing) n=1 Tax=Jeotgalibacillus proteolyticus TaxID=2082395 RepID=A0A2S5GCD1_9BACL|nr:asparagine synthase (glutamine-hydrolyzing) [Jeotgalibacillus proteolyticus]PPA70697.1 asparagine synthase (glutamine-hydrolyzing) [Jeotgalibacillus proteolyticus]
MCGITGWIDWKRDLMKEEPIMKKMTQTLSKRGPDASAIKKFPCALLGHTRLVVVDPSGGAQPMTKSRGEAEYTLVYNGELYNTEDVRAELLKKGHTFSSHSDTEVLLTAYIEWKEDCLKYFNGIFAFAIWNHKKEELFAARDRLGVKPFFYKHDGAALLFGSELKAILAHPEGRAEVDEEGLQEIFGMGPSRTPGHGVFKGVFELRPAHAMLFTRDGLKNWRYWNVESKEHSDTLEETSLQVRDLLKDAVERQLVADVPVCTFLSGGVDSSAISSFASAFMEQEGRGQLPTYSIDYEQNSHYFKASAYQPNEDGPAIQLMQHFLGSAHHTSTMDNELLAKRLYDAMTAKDLPGMADVDSSLLWFCEQIKTDFTVGLSGECADEIFGGYPWFYKKELLNAGQFPWMRSQSERESLLLPQWKKKLHISEYVQKRYEDLIGETPYLDGESEEEKRRREMSYLNMVSFMTTLLDRKDRMSMAASLEVRVPFADHRIVEYAWNIPWHMKMLNGQEKGILRKALEGVLPLQILYRKKSPYPKTHHPAYTKAVTLMLEDVVKKSSSPILEFMAKEKLQELIDTNGASFKGPWFGQLMSGPQLIAHLVQMNSWFEAYRVKVV